MELTQKEFDELPLAAAKSHISGLLAIYIHHKLSRDPASIVTEEGQFRLARRQWELAASAEAAADSYAGPLDGSLADLLRRIAGVSKGLNSPDDGSSEPSSEDFPGGEKPMVQETRFNIDIVHEKIDDRPRASDALEDLAKKLADEALCDLQRLTDLAVRAKFEERRKEIVKHALDALD